jgi:hypothetical protein
MDLIINETVEEIINPGMPLGACLLLTCKGCTKAGEVGCTVYRNIFKLSWHRQGLFCPFNAPTVESKKAKINPLKASKRGQ